MLVSTALSAAAVVQANACGASVSSDISEITDVEAVQSIEKGEVVLPSGPAVSRAVSSPVPITTDLDAAVPKFAWPVRGNLVVPTCSNPPDLGSGWNQHCSARRHCRENCREWRCCLCRRRTEGLWKARID